MGVGTIILSIIHIIICLFLIVMVLMQSGKSAGLSGSIAGGAETFFGKNKAKTLAVILNKYTKVGAVAFLITSIVLYLLLK